MQLRRLRVVYAHSDACRQHPALPRTVDRRRPTPDAPLHLSLWALPRLHRGPLLPAAPPSEASLWVCVLLQGLVLGSRGPLPRLSQCQCPLALVTRRHRHSRLREPLEVGPSTGQPVDGVLVVVLVVSVAEKIFVRLRRLRRRGVSRGLASRSLTCRAPETIALGRSGVVGRRRPPSTGTLERQVERRARRRELAKCTQRRRVA